MQRPTWQLELESLSICAQVMTDELRSSVRVLDETCLLP